MLLMFLLLISSVNQVLVWHDWCQHIFNFLICWWNEATDTFSTILILNFLLLTAWGSHNSPLKITILNNIKPLLNGLKRKWIYGSILAIQYTVSPVEFRVFQIENCTHLIDKLLTGISSVQLRTDTEEKEQYSDDTE